MRELIAKLAVGMTVAVVVVLSLLFAARHNPRAPATVAAVSDGGTPRPALPNDVVPMAPKTPDNIARGRAVYAQQNCSACHSISGDGNPRAPLDDVGARHNATDLRAWITGTGAAADVLAPATVRRKQRYLNAPAGDLDALVAYLSTLKSAK